MSETVSFKSNGDEASGYLALPASGSGPGVIVIQEWWGLNPQIKGFADRLAGEGFVALAPDLYHGELAEHDEMDKAGHLMNTLPMDRAARDMSGAVAYLLSRDEVSGDKLGVIGFCMGGMLSLVLAANEGDRIGAVAPYYGAPLGDDGPDWSNLTAKVHGHFAENDDFFGPEPVKALEAKLKEMGKDVTFEVHAGTGHAFANETNAIGTYDKDEAEKALAQSFAFLRQNLQA
jgi:carboxymethylenebutenolidase